MCKCFEIIIIQLALNTRTYSTGTVRNLHGKVQECKVVTVATVYHLYTMNL